MQKDRDAKGPGCKRAGMQKGGMQKGQDAKRSGCKTAGMQKGLGCKGHFLSGDAKGPRMQKCQDVNDQEANSPG